RPFRSSSSSTHTPVSRRAVMRSLFSTRARPHQMLKREREKLERTVNVYILENGGKHIPEEVRFLSYDLEIPTLAGLLRLRVDGAVIFCRFDDVSLACRRLVDGLLVDNDRLNRHTGKWNWHFGRTTAQEAFGTFVRELEPLLRPKVGKLEVVLAKNGVNVVAPDAFGDGTAAPLLVAPFPTYGHDPAIRQFVRALVTAYNDRFFRPVTPSVKEKEHASGQPLSAHRGSLGVSGTGHRGQHAGTNTDLVPASPRPPD